MRRPMWIVGADAVMCPRHAVARPRDARSGLEVSSPRYERNEATMDEEITQHKGTFNVTMLSALRGDFERWLAGRGLMMAEVPDMPGKGFIVVPQEFHL